MHEKIKQYSNGVGLDGLAIHLTSILVNNFTFDLFLSLFSIILVANSFLVYMFSVIKH